LKLDLGALHFANRFVESLGSLFCQALGFGIRDLLLLGGGGVALQLGKFFFKAVCGLPIFLKYGNNFLEVGGRACRLLWVGGRARLPMSSIGQASAGIGGPFCGSAVVVGFRQLFSRFTFSDEDECAVRHWLR